MTRPEGVRCERCCFWDRVCGGQEWGMCHRLPASEFDEDEDAVLWPQLLETAWCGEFRETWPGEEACLPRDVEKEGIRCVCGRSYSPKGMPNHQLWCPSVERKCPDCGIDLRCGVTRCPRCKVYFGAATVVGRSVSREVQSMWDKWGRTRTSWGNDGS